MKFKFVKILSLVGLLVGAPLLFTSCGGPTNGNTDNNDKKFIDYVKTNPITRLKLDYKDETGKSRNFYEDGIAQVSLRTAIDGDTAHFKMPDYPDEPVIKSRFYGVDTPESTGKVEEWGQTASDFTKEKLNNANKNGTIVVSSVSIDTYLPPETDSTGVRYLSLIWINETKKDAPISELDLLNLWLVQDGLSTAKNGHHLEAYKDVFYDAEIQAREFKLNMHSDEHEPGFNRGDYAATSIIDIYKEIQANLKDEAHVNAFENKRVRLRGTVVGYANNILYLEEKNLDTGEIGRINIFTGASPIPSKYTIPNTYLDICGLCKTSENFGFQLSGVPRFPKTTPRLETDTRILYTPSDIPEDLKASENVVKGTDLYKNYDLLFAPVEVEGEVTVTNAYESDSQVKDITLSETNINGVKNKFSIYIPFMYQPDPNDPTIKFRTKDDFIGHTFKVKGIYSFHKTMSGKITFQIVLTGQEDLILIK